MTPETMVLNVDTITIGLVELTVEVNMTTNVAEVVKMEGLVTYMTVNVVKTVTISTMVVVVL